jgi:hypothetical protein
VLSRLVSYWSDPRDIHIAVHKSLRELTLQGKLTGWVKGDRVAKTTLSLQEDLSSLRNVVGELESKNQQLEAELRLEKNRPDREVYWDADLASVHGLILIYMAWLAIDRNVNVNLRELMDRLKWDDYNYAYGFLVALRTAKLIVFTSDFKEHWSFLYLHPALTKDFKNDFDRRIKQLLEAEGIEKGDAAVYERDMKVIKEYIDELARRKRIDF